MNKCLSCGHIRHDLVLNCPKCGSFYSTFEVHPPIQNPKNTNDSSPVTNAVTNDDLTVKNNSSSTTKALSFFEWLQIPVEIKIKHIIITIGVLLMLVIRVILCK